MQRLALLQNMKITLDFQADKLGFIKRDMVATFNVETDAENLGYICTALFEASQVLANQIEKLEPKYQPRIARGVEKALMDKESQQDFPFTSITEVI